MTSPLKFATTSSFVSAVILVCACIAPAAETIDGPAKPAATLISYQVAGGDSYFALSLTAGRLPSATAPHDHAVLVDTSASQTGEHRRQTLAVLEGCLEALGADNRVCIFAVDVEAKPFTEGYHPPQSDEVQAALAKLRKRVPLGATNLKLALETGLKSFAGDHLRSIIYIGDGMSTGGLIPIPAMRRLLAELRQNKVPVHSFAVGPRTDLQMLGVLAEHTGGVVFVDEYIDDAKQSAATTGRLLAAAAAAPVFYPSRLTLEPPVENLLPLDPPPLRSDRSTILLGRGAVPASLKVRADGPDGESKLDWTVTPTAAQAGNTFLFPMWNVAEQDKGVNVPVAGEMLLNVARQAHQERVMGLAAWGHRAVAAGNLPVAEQIAWMLRQADPANVEARTILSAVEKSKRARSVSKPPAAPRASPK